MSKNPNIEEIIDKVNEVSLNKISTSITNNTPKFVINPIIYVDGIESDDSSDEDYNSLDEKLFTSLDTQNKNELPFRTFKITESRAKKTVGEDKFSKPVGFLGEKKENIEVVNFNTQISKNSIAQTFLDKLKEEGIEEESDIKIEDISSVSILLNRPLSISTRKNNLLIKELESRTESPIIHKKTGIFWEFNWYNNNNKIVKSETVREFYKKLKKYDKDKKTSKAEQFRTINEKGIAVPYQDLRERAKNHENTITLVKDAKENNDSDIYLSIVDGDTESFNGIYSAYMRIHKGEKTAPTIMSTGYEFPKDEQNNNSTYQLASQIDRMIRVITAKHVPLGVYYPEPNMCVLIPKKYDTVLESFIDKKRKKGDLESASLLRKVSLRQDATFVFSNDNPLITTVPPRAKLTKTHKTPITFSDEFSQGASLTEKDLQTFKQISQSHFHEKVWYDNLFINHSIKIDSIKLNGCKSLLAKIRNRNVTNDERNQAIKELKEFIDPNIVDSIITAAAEIKQYIDKFKIEYIRSEDEETLLKIFKKKNINIKDFSRDQILILAQIEVLKLFQSEVIDINDLKKISLKQLKSIFYNDETIEMLQNEDISINELLNLAKISTRHNQDYSIALKLFIKAVENRDYSTEEILNLYEEHEFHLMFMADSPNDIIIENFDNVEIVLFGIENYDIDIEEVRDALEPDGAEGGSVLMEFDRMIGYNDDYDYDDYYDDY